MQPRHVSIDINWSEGYDIAVVVDDHFTVIRQLPPTNSFDDAWNYAIALMKIEMGVSGGKDAEGSDRSEVG